MSIEAVLNNALSALMYNQTALTTTSQNVANVGTEGYVRRTVQGEPVVVDGVTTGVDAVIIREAADRFLAGAMLEATSQTERYEILTKVHDEIQALLGDPNQNLTLSARLSDVFSAISGVAFEAASLSQRSELIAKLEALAQTFSDLAREIQQLRQNVDQQISFEVAAANPLIKEIFDLNAQIATANAIGDGVPGLFDQRDAAVRQLSEIMDIRTEVKADGRIWVATENGQVLVSEIYKELQYTAKSGVSGSTQFNQITLHTVNPNTGVADPVGLNISPDIVGGRLRGLIDARDSLLPEFAQGLGELAAKVVDSFNAVHNDSTSVPAQNTLTGRNTGLIAGDAHGFTGDVTIAVTDATGNLVTRVDVDFDANTYSVDGGGPVAFAGTTLGDAVAAINTGLGANGSATLTNGVLTLDAANGAEGIAILDDAATPSSRAGRGFAHFFGLNDLLSTGQPAHFETGLAGGDAHGFTAGQTVDFTLVGPNGKVAAQFTYTVAGATIANVVTALNAGVNPFGTFSLNASGEITFAPDASVAGYEIFASNDITSRSTTGVALSELFGLSPHFKMDRAANMSVRSDIATDPANLALAKLDITGATAPGDLVLTISDSRGAQALDALALNSMSFAAAGGLAAMTASLGAYSDNVLAQISAQATRFDALAADNAAIRSELVSRTLEVEGVNLDEELANMILYQQYYNAAARLIQTANQLYDALLAIA